MYIQYNITSRTFSDHGGMSLDCSNPATTSFWLTFSRWWGWEVLVGSARLNRNLHWVDRDGIDRNLGRLPYPNRPDHPDHPDHLFTMLIQHRLWRWFYDADPNVWMLIPEAAPWRWFDSIVSDLEFTRGVRCPGGNPGILCSHICSHFKATQHDTASLRSTIWISFDSPCVLQGASYSAMSFLTQSASKFGCPASGQRGMASTACTSIGGAIAIERSCPTQAAP
jgi:hypothetical protein